MTSTREIVPIRPPVGMLRPGPRRIERLRGIGLVGAGSLVGVCVAQLIAMGLWFVVVALVLVLPGFVLIQRAPLATIAIWLFVSPFLTVGSLRPAFWAVHRALPLVTLFLLFASGTVGVRRRQLGRLGWAEVMIAAYVAVSAVSALYTSDEAGRAVINLYDRVVVPACLYLLVRLVRPTQSALRRLGPVAAFVVVAQAGVGAMQWAAPSILPPDWLGRAGTRTTGTLLNPPVFGVTLLAAGTLVLHLGSNSPHRWARTASRLLFAVAVSTAVLSLTRAVWLAAFVVVVVAAVAYPLQIRRLAIFTVPLLVVFVASGAAQGQIERIESRYSSDQTAMSRLPVAQASLRMFNEKPLTGWGYGNFDKYDREFQEEVNGFFPEKDHSSHNLYLTLLAEQGVLGAALYLGVAILWGVRSVDRYPMLPRSGLFSRKLLLLLWALLATHVVVNNFSNMQVVVGLGQWWLLLGLVGVLVTETGADETDGTPVRPVAVAIEPARPDRPAER